MSSESADGVTDEQKSKIRKILEQAQVDQASLADALTLIEHVLATPADQETSAEM